MKKGYVIGRFVENVTGRITLQGLSVNRQKQTKSTRQMHRWKSRQAASKYQSTHVDLKEADVISLDQLNVLQIRTGSQNPKKPRRSRKTRRQPDHNAA